MGFWELLVIVFLVLLFFGAGRLAGLGAGLGRAARGFKDALGTEAPPERPEPPAPPTPRELPPGGPAA